MTFPTEISDCPLARSANSWKTRLPVLRRSSKSCSKTNRVRSMLHAVARIQWRLELGRPLVCHTRVWVTMEQFRGQTCLPTMARSASDLHNPCRRRITRLLAIMRTAVTTPTALMSVTMMARPTTAAVLGVLLTVAPRSRTHLYRAPRTASAMTRRSSRVKHFVNTVLSISVSVRDPHRARAIRRRARMAFPAGRALVNLMDASGRAFLKVHMQVHYAISGISTREGAVRSDPCAAYSHPSPEHSLTFMLSCVDVRYFIIKSWNADNIEAAMRDSLWSTQQRNQRLFTDAYRTSRAVILCFSVNNSKAFQGYVGYPASVSSSP